MASMRDNSYVSPNDDGISAVDFSDSQDRPASPFFVLSDDPTNQIVPRFAGDVCIDTNTPTVWIASAEGDASSWAQVAGA